MKVWIKSSQESYFIENEIGEVFSGKHAGTRTQEEREYTAIIRALEHYKEEAILEIYSTNRLVVDQLNNGFGIRTDKLLALARGVWKLIEKRQVAFIWKENRI